MSLRPSGYEAAGRGPDRSPRRPDTPMGLPDRRIQQNPSPQAPVSYAGSMSPPGAQNGTIKTGDTRLAPGQLDSSSKNTSNSATRKTQNYQDMQKPSQPLAPSSNSTAVKVEDPRERRIHNLESQVEKIKEALRSSSRRQADVQNQQEQRFLDLEEKFRKLNIKSSNFSTEIDQLVREVRTLNSLYESLRDQFETHAVQEFQSYITQFKTNMELLHRSEERPTIFVCNKLGGDSDSTPLAGQGAQSEHIQHSQQDVKTGMIDKRDGKGEQQQKAEKMAVRDRRQ